MNEDLTARLSAIINDFRVAIRNDFRQVMQEIQSTQRVENSNATLIWLKAKDAAALIQVKSSKKWKALRESGLIHYLKEGKQYLYERNSLLEYQRKKSTLQFAINTKPKKKSNY